MKQITFTFIRRELDILEMNRKYRLIRLMLVFPPGSHISFNPCSFIQIDMYWTHERLRCAFIMHK
ncbi:MAG: hypothetical protein RLZZ43_791 [Actinomycetota bacterium]